MKMKLSPKFAAAAGACLLSLSMLAGCSGPQSPAQQAEQARITAEQAQGYRTYPDACVVVDQNPGVPYHTEYTSHNNTYDFRNGILLINTQADGGMYRSANSVPISALNDGGKQHAMDMFNKLPPAAKAKCEAPKLGR